MDVLLPGVLLPVQVLHGPVADILQLEEVGAVRRVGSRLEGVLLHKVIVLAGHALVDPR